jgi:N-acyl-phosphatidylethanolamine-hydrolysing phospholipase D
MRRAALLAPRRLPSLRFQSTAAAAALGAAAGAEPAHHVRDARGRRTFRNPPAWGSYVEHSPLDFITQALPQWRWSTRGYALPAHSSPAAAAAMAQPTSPLQCRWVGHVTFLLQLGGLNILTDPMFSEYASPVQGLGPARYTPVPASCTLAALPPIDVVLISHSHYDHLDRGSVRELLARWGPGLTWVVPLGLPRELEAMGVAPEAIRELDWWQAARVHGGSGSGSARGSRGSRGSSTAAAEEDAAATITAVPAQHQSARSAFDRNRTLWAGFVVQAGGRSVYFAGDTGYRSTSAEGARGPPCPAFKQIGAHFKSIDLALLPVGAYSPESFMSSFHANPEDAVDMFFDVRARAALGMHWGTFLLTDEPITEPRERLQAAVRARGLQEKDFRAVRHGEMWQEGGVLL